MSTSLFRRDGLSALQLARLEDCLAQPYRFSDGVRTLGADLEARFARGEIVAKKASNGMIDFSRTRFNRMNAKEQLAYMRRLEAKRCYWLEDAEGTGRAVPKTVFDAVDLPVATHSVAA